MTSFCKECFGIRTSVERRLVCRFPGPVLTCFKTFQIMFQNIPKTVTCPKKLTFFAPGHLNLDEIRWLEHWHFFSGAKTRACWANSPVLPWLKNRWIGQHPQWCRGEDPMYRWKSHGSGWSYALIFNWVMEKGPLWLFKVVMGDDKLPSYSPKTNTGHIHLKINGSKMYFLLNSSPL